MGKFGLISTKLLTSVYVENWPLCSIDLGHFLINSLQTL